MSSWDSAEASEEEAEKAMRTGGICVWGEEGERER